MSHGLAWQAVASPARTPLGVYVHFPWCVSKCPYCDFNSHALRGELPESGYVAALQRDIETHLNSAPTDFATREVVSVFLGGGTPSLFSPTAIGQVLDGLRTKLRLAADVEVTMEANPATIERGRFAEYRAAGVNRVSLGAQSFSLSALKALGRIHTPAETRLAAEELHAAGIDNFNIDLMYGLPGQDVASALQDLQSALELGPAQISHYHLTMEPGTPFAVQPPPGLPQDELIDEILSACQQTFGSHDFWQYEVSAYARLGSECRHNLVYWTFGDYLGLGAGAHGKLSGPDPEDGRVQIWRSQRPRDPRRYQREVERPVSWKPVPPIERPFEFMLNALRLSAGVPAELFAARTGLPLECQRSTLEGLLREGYLAGDPMVMGRLQASARGFRYLNEVLLQFLPQQN